MKTTEVGKYNLNSLPPLKISKKDIAVAVNKVIEKYNFDPRKDSLKSLISKMGGKLEETSERNLGVLDSKLEALYDKEKFVIQVRKNLEEEEKRFFIAHEIGHYVLHSVLKGGEKIKVNVETMEEVDTRNLSEIEADEFAKNLLMPENLFREEVERIKKIDPENILVGIAYSFKVRYHVAKERDEALYGL